MPHRTSRQRPSWKSTLLWVVALAASLAIPAASASEEHHLQMGTMNWAPLEVGQPVYAYAYLAPFEYGYAHEGSIDFGDGSEPVAIANNGRQSPRVVSHVYEAGGTYTITGIMAYTGHCQPRYCHDGGPWAGQGSESSLAIVIDGGNTAPTVDAGSDVQRLPSRSHVDIAALISDPDAGDSHTATIDWGDGSMEVLAVDGALASGSHDYGGRGHWTATVCVQDAAGEESCDSLEISIDGAHGKPSSDMHPGRGQAQGLEK